MTSATRFGQKRCSMLPHNNVVEARLFAACFHGLASGSLAPVQRNTEIGLCSDPYRFWTSPWCVNCTTTQPGEMEMAPLSLWMDILACPVTRAQADMPDTTSSMISFATLSKWGVSYSLCTGGGEQPDGVTQIPWKFERGRWFARYAICPNTFS